MKNIVFIFLVLPALIYSQSTKTFMQQQRTLITTEDGLPNNQIRSVAVTDDGFVYAATAAGAAVRENGRWRAVPVLNGKDITKLVADGKSLLVAYQDGEERSLAILQGGQVALNMSLQRKKWGDLSLVGAAFLAKENGVYSFDWPGGKFKSHLVALIDAPLTSAVKRADDIWAASEHGLFLLDPSSKKAVAQFPRDGDKSWAPADIAGLAVDAADRLWFASPQGVGSFDGESWSLYTGADGLPYNRFTCVAAGGDGAVWFGTQMGAIRFDGTDWEYRQGKRWLPDDKINDIAVDKDGNAWIATDKGISLIERVPMTLAKKAKWYEDEIDRYHRRTPYGYVLEVSTAKPGDKSEIRRHDSDNDGLWTSMYGAGECYAWAATHDSLAKQRADRAFAALEFLGTVTQGGPHPAPPGFVARTILPTSGPDPNIGRVERDKHNKATDDSLWKVIDPRWPVSADSAWYWKCDTSSDELDGHYFFYGLYYDLVAETEAEKTRVVRQVRALTDHLIAHDYQLVDHDGLPTRWARFDPYELNHDANWVFDRNINSLSMLSYLLTAAHITGDNKYIKYAKYLVENHGYLQNAQLPKTQRGIGTGNQSDDEMAMMCLHNFIKYSPNPDWTGRIALALWTYGRMELPEMNPFFNYIYASMCAGQSFRDAWGVHPLNPTGDWRVDALETLQRFPLDRFDWRHDNSKRIDIVRLEDVVRHFDEGSYANRGRRVNGKVIPVDESHFNHWNRDPFDLVTGGSGRGLADGAVFLLPYYMGLYYGYIE